MDLASSSETGGGMEMDDRRRYPRREKSTIVSYSVLENGKNEEDIGHVVDGGIGGVRFRAKRSISKNSRVYIRLNSKEWGEDFSGFFVDEKTDNIEMIGMVMWCLESDEKPGEYEIGARFVGFTEH